MHEHCEILMPSTDDVKAAVASIMSPFDENDDDCINTFWDFWCLGGRWAGNKQMAKYDKDKVDAFHQWMFDEGVTVSGLQCGKQEINPASQIPKVDAKWNEFFPPASGDQQSCPLFKHSNDPYSQGVEGCLNGDICSLAEADGVTCGRVIIAGPSYEGDANERTRTGPPEATFMLCRDQWNGVNHMSVVWDGTLSGAVAQFRESLKHYADDYREQMSPQDDWLTVTVDYHA